MSKPAKGTKRVCPSCGARFYDLNRTPIVCPACQAVYQVPAPTRRGERAQPPEPIKEVPIVKKPPVPEPETIVLSDAEDPAEVIPIEDEEEIVDLGDDEVEVPPGGDDENAFLEETADEEPDVSGIVSGPPGEEA
jgi:uncharacterized protein (TIGR02300 family)